MCTCGYVHFPYIRICNTHIRMRQTPKAVSSIPDFLTLVHLRGCADLIHVCQMAHDDDDDYDDDDEMGGGRTRAPV